MWEAALLPGWAVTTPEGDLIGSRWDLDARVLLEEWDLVDPVGRIRVERLEAALQGRPVSATRVGGGWVVAVGPVADLSPDELAAAIASVSLVLAQRRVDRDDQALRWQQAWADVLGGVAEPSALGWSEDQPLVVLALGVDPRTHRTDAAWERLVDHWSRSLEALTTPAAPARFVEVDQGLRIIAPVQVVPAIDEISALVFGEMARVRPFRVGVSRVAAGIGHIAVAADEATRALALGGDGEPGGVTYFHRVGLERLLARIPELDAADFVTDMLGPLAADSTEADGLRRTLELLLETDFNVAETARRQFLHYTTVRYRVALFERWFGPVAEDPARRVDLAVALMLVDRGH